MKTVTVAVIGGDLRFRSLAEALAQDGHRVRLFAMEQLNRQSRAAGIQICQDLHTAASGAACVIAPLPICNETQYLATPFSEEWISITGLLDAMDPNTVLLGGKLPKEIYDLAEARNIIACDYLEREEFAVLNAIPTAEGAIQIAMEELSVTLAQARCLVVGYGRIGKLLAHKLKALGANVIVSARKCSDLAWIHAYGFTPVTTNALQTVLPQTDVIFNTVPYRIFTEDTFSLLPDHALCIDLASKPGGFDLDAAKRHAIRVIWALSLPGKVAPLTAGTIIRDTVVNILTELGIF